MEDEHDFLTKEVDDETEWSPASNAATGFCLRLHSFYFINYHL